MRREQRRGCRRASPRATRHVAPSLDAYRPDSRSSRSSSRLRVRARANERRSSGAASWVSPGRVEHNVAVTLAPLSPSATMSNLIEPGENGPEINAFT